MASFSDILGINAYTIFWLAPFYLIPIYGLLVYGLASVLTKDRMQSLFAGMLGASIGGGEVLLGPQYLFPSTLFILIFLLSLIAFIESPLKGVSQIVLGFALFAVTFALYYYPLFLATVPIVAFLIDHGANSRFAQWRKPALLGSVAISIVLTILGSMLLAGVTLPLGQLTSILRSAYPDALWLLIILGSLVVLRRLSQDRTGYSVQAMMVLYVAMLIGIYFLPISSSWRSELMLRPFAAIVASYSLPLLSSSLSRASEVISRFDPDINSLSEKSDRLVKLSLVLFIAFSTSLVVQTYVSYAQHVPNWSNISSDEYQAAQWLSEKTPAGGYILTDPSTGMMLRGVALLNSSTSFIIGGHTPSPQRYPGLRKVIYAFFTSQNGTDIPIYLSELPHAPDFIVITSRTASWASWGGVNSTFPAPTTNSPSSFPGFGKFNSSSFAMVSKWETVMIYRLIAV